jgi:imidazole glycerol-phosphate synthase subunit HisF
MLKNRVIPVLSFNGFALVKTMQFGNPRMVGNPMQAARVYNSRNVDELIFADIFASRQKRKLNLAVVKQVVNECFMPVTIGGGIDSLKDINNLLQIGADKVVIKSTALNNPPFITEAAKVFGSQCIVVSVDVNHTADGWKIHYPEGNDPMDAIEFIKRVESLGAGELFINDVRQDGMMKGFDLQMFETLSAATNLPVIACGGAGLPDHFVPLLANKNITGLAAASIFHFTQYTPFDIKFAIDSAGYPVRLFDHQHLKEGVNL